MMEDSLKSGVHLVGKLLQDANIPHVLIGGIAVNAYGYSRSTMDVDFMVAASKSSSVTQAMRNAGFSNISMCENVIFFSRPGSALRVDILLTDEQTMNRLVSTAVSVDCAGSRQLIPSLENLLAMKLFALASGKAKRVDKDLPDIAWLATINNLDLEQAVLPLCLRYANPSIYEQIKMKIDEIQAA